MYKVLLLSLFWLGQAEARSPSCLALEAELQALSYKAISAWGECLREVDAREDFLAALRYELIRRMQEEIFKCGGNVVCIAEVIKAYEEQIRRIDDELDRLHRGEYGSGDGALSACIKAEAIDSEIELKQKLYEKLCRGKGVAQ